MPVPVTVGFYAPFGCRLHLMLDKIMSEYPHALSVGGGQETRFLVPALFFKSRLFPVTSIPTKSTLKNPHTQVSRGSLGPVSHWSCADCPLLPVL